MSCPKTKCQARSRFETAGTIPEPPTQSVGSRQPQEPAAHSAASRQKIFLPSHAGPYRVTQDQDFPECAHGPGIAIRAGEDGRGACGPGGLERRKIPEPAEAHACGVADDASPERTSEKTEGVHRMIRVTNIRSMSPGSQDEAYAIVRSMKSSSAWLKQLAVLSPSTDLFYRYLNLKKAGQWSERTFREIYVPQFLHELRWSREAAESLNQLVRKDQSGLVITLGCFCPDEALCHRSIVAGLLQHAGCDVRTDTGRDYSAYYAQYLSA